MAGPTILLSAGEPSGDLHGAELAGALKRRWPAARLIGLGGSRMAHAGVEVLGDMDKLGVIGLVEALRHLPYHVQLLRRLGQVIHEQKPDLVIPIDYPGLNLRLSRKASRAGIPVLYYIAPQVWAWHRGRARQLARYTDHVAVILPFEESIFRGLGMRASYVGHPLLDTVPVRGSREEFAGTLHLSADQPILALFPGSRAGEVRRHLELFSRAAKLVQEQYKEVQPVIARSREVPADAYHGVPYPCTDDSWELLHHSRAALLKSGTSTLEAALAGTPMVISYRTHPLTYWLARRLVRVEHVGLVNLVANERLFPELLQGEATPSRLASALTPLLCPDDPERHSAVSALARVCSLLRPDDAAAMTVADRVCLLAERLVER